MATPPAPPLLGCYVANGAFPTPGPSAWPSGPTTNLAATYMAWGQDFPTYAGAFITACNSNSLIPFVELEPWDSGASWDVTPLFSDITGGTWDSWLQGVGTFIAGTGKPVILTFGHEMNVSGQYPWSQGDTGSGPGGGTLTPAEWIAGWKYVHDKINSTAGGLALWMWACSAWTGGTTIDPSPWWPGISYVDMVGIDGYPTTTYGASLGTFTGQIGQTVTAIRALGWSSPIFISETNLAQMVASGGESITSFVADMHAAGCSGILEFEEYYEPDMTSAQWAEYNTAVAAAYGTGGTSGGGGSSGGGSGGTPTYTQVLIDNFNTGSSLNSTIWRIAVGGEGISVSGGKLAIEGISGSEQVVAQTTANINLANGICAMQLSQSGTPSSGTMWFYGINDAATTLDNYWEFQTFPGRAQWYSWAGTGAATANDTGNQNILSPSVWNNGDWLGLGNYNLNGTNDVHVYKSSDGVTWTEIAAFTVTGQTNENSVEFYFGTNYDPGAAASTYVATVDNVSFFTRGASSGGGGGTGGGAGGSSGSTYSLFGGAAPSGGSAAANTGTLGLLVTTSQVGTLPAIAFYSPPGSTVLPSQIALYAVTGQVLVTSKTPAWSGAAGSGWVTASFTSAPALAVSTQYMAAVFGTNLNYYFTDSYFSTGAGESGVTSGPLSAPGGGGSAAQGYYNPASSLAYPSSQYDSGYFGLDVEFAATASAVAASPGLLMAGIA